MKFLIQTLLFCLMFTQINAQCEQQDYIALRALYLDTDGDNWTNNDEWPNSAFFVANPTMPLGTDVSAWNGVTTNVNGCVIALVLFSNNLSGSIPPEIEKLNDLIQLKLSGNELNGSIPPEIGNLNNLTELWLNLNNLSGSIPLEIGNLINLTELRLSSNNLSGSILPEIGNLINLTQLYLDSNELSGSIPPEIGNLINLTQLWLNSNELSGSIPLEIGNLINLIQLRLSSNNLNGSILPEIGNLINLIQLYLDSNELSGSIPPEIGNLINLTELRLFTNELSGSIPPEIGNLINLTALILSNNNLSGSVPPEIGNLINLTALSLQLNNLSGGIPPEIGNLINLTELWLQSNELTGSIPPEIGNLINLTILWLHSNQLSGCYNSNLSSLCVQLTNSTNQPISDGNNFDAPWESFCTTETGVCDITDLVLPGDFDNDGTVEGKDLLYWGVAYGNTGPTRSNATTDWTPQYNPEDWTTSVDGVNSKHQDANGDGIVDTLDVGAFELNYAETDGNIDSFECHSTDAMFVIEALEVDTVLNEIHFELHIASDMPISTHGISTKIDISGISNLHDVQVDTSDSSLEPKEFFYKKIGNTIDITLTRIDKTDQIIDGSVASVVVTVKDIQSFTVSVNRGQIMSGAGKLTGIGGSDLSYHLGKSVSLEVNTYCNEKGSARIHVADATDYSYLWSTGATTISIEDLDVGNYSVTVSDAIGTTTIDFDIIWALPYIDVDLHVWLEGAYNPDDEMSTTLSELGLLPTGQPYHIAPWNYTGTEGADWTDTDYTDDVTDWILVSFRTDIQKDTEVGMTAGLLQKDGSITFPNRCILDPTIASPVYIVVEHRNHIGVMTPTLVDIVSGTLTHDFRAADSYDGDGTGSGQKQLPTGEWGMFAGDGDQTGDTFSFDITGADKTIWTEENGQFRQYRATDYDLDGDVNGNDKVIWEPNNGKSSRVPR